MYVYDVCKHMTGCFLPKEVELSKGWAGCFYSLAPSIPDQAYPPVQPLSLHLLISVLVYSYGFLFCF